MHVCDILRVGVCKIVTQIGNGDLFRDVGCIIATLWAECYPDSKAYGAKMRPICGRQDPGGPHVGPMNFAIWVCIMRMGQLYLLSGMQQVHRGLSELKPASNDVGCICEQIWKEQCRMKTYIAVNLTKWYWSKICITLVKTIKNFLTFVMPLNWAGIIGYMLTKGRPFYSSDVILLHQVTVPLHQGMVPLFGLHQTQ